MKFIVLKVGLLSVISACAVMATPVDSRQISADVGWAIHVDVDRLKETQAGKMLLDEVNKPENQQKIEWFQTVFGFDPLKAIRGVTLYGGVERAEDGVLLIRGDFDTNRLAQLPKGWPEYHEEQHGNHMVFSWIDKNKFDQPRVFAAISGDTVILSKKPGLVENSLDVIDGVKPSLRNVNPFDGLGLNEGKAFLVGGVSKTGRFGPKPIASIVKQIKFIGVVVEEEDGKVKIDLPMRAFSPEATQSMADLARGIVALLTLQEDPNAVLLGKSITVTQKNETIISSLKLPVDDAIRLFESVKKKKLLH